MPGQAKFYLQVTRLIHWPLEGAAPETQAMDCPVLECPVPSRSILTVEQCHSSPRLRGITFCKHPKWLRLKIVLRLLILPPCMRTLAALGTELSPGSLKGKLPV